MFLIPINKRLITMNVKLNDIKKEWLKNIDKKYFLAEFSQW